MCIVAGGGKVGANVARSLLRLGQEVTLIEQRRDRFERLEEEFEHQVQRGDATELFVLERAGITRPPDIVLALTGDDEDNIVICQLAKEKYLVPKVIARVNDPRNQAHFDLLGISPTICATSSIMALVEHEVPEHDLIHLLELRKENLEIVEVQIDKDSPVAGQARRGAVAAGGRAPHLGDARRPGGDRRRVDDAPGRRPGARDPRAGQGRRAPQGVAEPVAGQAFPRGRRLGLVSGTAFALSPSLRSGSGRWRDRRPARRTRRPATTGRASAGRPSRTSAPTFATGITAANVRSLQRQQVQLDGTVDSSPIYLHGVQVGGGTHDVFFVTTTYGKTDRGRRRERRRCSGRSRRPATRRGPAARRSRPRRRSPTRAAVRSTRRRPTGRSTSSRSRTATRCGARRSRSCPRARRSPRRSTTRTAA